MAEGGRDSSGPHGIFSPSKKPNLQSGHILVIIRMLRTAGQGWQPCLQELREESCSEGRQHLDLLTFTLQPSPATVQQMQGKLTLSSGDVCVCRVFSV